MSIQLRKTSICWTSVGPRVFLGIKKDPKKGLSYLVAGTGLEPATFGL